MKALKLVLMAVIGLGLTLGAGAQTIVIKMGSVAPESSPWGAGLNKLAAEFKKVSGGKVELKIYHNGVAGGEGDQLRKMKIGQLQAGVFTSFGLNEISPEFLSLSIPFLIQNEEELDYVLSKLKPVLEAKIEGKKFKMVAWSRAGWVRFFGRKPIVYPADLKAQKLAANPDDQVLFQAWKVLGYQQVPVAIPDILMSLNSGLVEAVFSSPIAVGGFQWFGLAKNMSDIKISPFMGGVVFNQATWDKIPADIKPKLQEALRKTEAELDRNIKVLEADAINTMKKYGLNVVPVPAPAVQAWKNEVDQSIEKLLGKTFSREMYNLIRQYVEEYRKK